MPSDGKVRANEQSKINSYPGSHNRTENNFGMLWAYYEEFCPIGEGFSIHLPGIFQTVLLQRVEIFVSDESGSSRTQSLHVKTYPEIGDFNF